MNSERKIGSLLILFGVVIAINGGDHLCAAIFGVAMLALGAVLFLAATNRED